MPRISAYDQHRWQVIKLLRDLADAPTDERRKLVENFAAMIEKSSRTVYAWLEKARNEGTPLRDLVEVPEGPTTGHDCNGCSRPAHLIGPGNQHHCDACFSVVRARQNAKLAVTITEDRNSAAIAAIERYEKEMVQNG